jgi:hypothetical protein
MADKMMDDLAFRKAIKDFSEEGKFLAEQIRDLCAQGEEDKKRIKKNADAITEWKAADELRFAALKKKVWTVCLAIAVAAGVLSNYPDIMKVLAAIFKGGI